MLKLRFFSTLLTATVFLSIVFLACETANKETANTSEVATDTSVVAETASSTEESATNVIKEFGLVKNIEDSGYPMFNVTIEFPERKMTETFLLNAEADVNQEIVQSAKGKYVNFSYTSELENGLFDLTLNGKSLLPKDAQMPKPNNAKTITGKLSNASEVTGGDLPDDLEVIAADGKVYRFPFYISKEIVAANGKTVHALYTEDVTNRIVSMEVKK